MGPVTPSRRALVVAAILILAAPASAQDRATGAKVVYLGFGFEGIDNAQDRHDLLVPTVR